jgi:hypothetical protein
MVEGAKWIAKILKLDLEIKPTKLIKGRGLAKLLVESNCKYLRVKFINTCSKNHQDEMFDKGPRDNPPLAGCTWYKDIIFFSIEFAASRWYGKEKGKIFKAQRNQILPY